MLKTVGGNKARKHSGVEDPYLAANEFSKMRNKPQDRANMGQRKRVFMDALNEMSSPEKTEAKRNHLARGLCKWHFGDRYKCVETLTDLRTLAKPS